MDTKQKKELLVGEYNQLNKLLLETQARMQMTLGKLQMLEEIEKETQCPSRSTKTK